MKLIKNKILLLSLFILSSTAIQASEFVSHTVLNLPDDPRIEEPWSQVINTQEDWELFFNSTLAHILFLASESPIPPELDFENHRVLTGGLGVRSSGGYFLSIEKVTELDDVIDIHILEVSPGSNCLSFAALTYPSTSIMVRNSNKPFRFTVSHLVNECLD